MLDNDLKWLAAEYALGTLSAGERAQAEELLAKNAVFARAVEDWEGQLAPLSEVLPSETPPASVWSRIEEGIKDADGVSDSPDFLTKQLWELRGRLTVWRYVAMGAVAASILMGIVVARNVSSDLFGPHERYHYVAMLMDDSGKYGFIITFVPETEKLMIRKVVAGVPSAKKHELWLIKADGSVPASLGVLTEEALLTVDVSGKVPMDDFADGVKLAVSVEPPEGAPSGLDMGPVVFAGLLMKQMP